MEKSAKIKVRNAWKKSRQFWLKLFNWGAQSGKNKLLSSFWITKLLVNTKWEVQYNTDLSTFKGRYRVDGRANWWWDDKHNTKRVDLKPYDW